MLINRHPVLLVLARKIWYLNGGILAEKKRKEERKKKQGRRKTSTKEEKREQRRVRNEKVDRDAGWAILPRRGKCIRSGSMRQINQTLINQL